MSRGRQSLVIPNEFSNLDDWPEPKVSSLSESDQLRYKNNLKAIRLFAVGKSMLEISTETGIHENSVRALIRRSLKRSDDASIFGFFAAIPRLRIKPYTRQAPENAKFSASRGGMSGLMGGLLRDYPSIAHELEQIVLKYAGPHQDTPGYVPWISVLESFHKLCRNAGISDMSWPFTAEYLGYESVRIWGHAVLRKYKERGVEIAIGTSAKKKLKVGTGDSSLLIAYAYADIWELDSHTIGCIGTIKIPLGESHFSIVPIDQITVTIIADRSTHSMPSWLISLNSAPTANDILRCVSRAAIGWMPPTPTIPGLVRDPNGGIPTQSFPKLIPSGCALLMVDNASAHLAKEVERKIRRTLGCAINFGEVATPNRRPLIEAINGKLEQLGFKLLPSSTGRHKSNSQTKTPAEIAVENSILQDELVQILDATMWRFNGLPIGALGYMSPMACLGQQVNDQSYLPLKIPNSSVSEKKICTTSIIKKLAGNPLKGRNLHINLDGGRYTSRTLINSGLSPRTPIAIEFDEEDDFRIIRASVVGTNRDLGVLKVGGMWARSKHDRKTRLCIIRLKRKRLLKLVDGGDPITIYLEYLANKTVEEQKERKGSPTKSKTGTELNRVSKKTDKDIPSVSISNMHPIERSSVRLVQARPLSGKLKNFSR